jgi:uncharacterized protein (TIGR04222 family)
MWRMAADTWGIAGPTFLVWYGVLAAVSVVASLILRGAVRRATSRVHTGEPGIEELAYFAGGPRQAMLATVAGLRAGGSVAVHPDGTIGAVGPVTPGPGELTWAVYQATRRPGARLRSLDDDPGVRAALDNVRAALVRRGWLRNLRARATTRLAALPVWVVLVVGVARIQAGVSNERPVGFIFLIVVVLALFAVGISVVPERNFAAQRTLSAYQAQYGYLNPRATPAPAVYGAGTAVLAVALFGTAALASADPALAAEAEDWLPAAVASSSGGGDSGGGSSCGGGGGGGGGGGCGG